MYIHVRHCQKSCCYTYSSTDPSVRCKQWFQVLQEHQRLGNEAPISESQRNSHPETYKCHIHTVFSQTLDRLLMFPKKQYFFNTPCSFMNFNQMKQHTPHNLPTPKKLHIFIGILKGPPPPCHL